MRLTGDEKEAAALSAKQRGLLRLVLLDCPTALWLMGYYKGGFIVGPEVGGATGALASLMSMYELL